MNRIPQEVLSHSLTYEAYRELIARLLAEGKTTGPNQSADLVEYARLNVQRMDRIDKTFRLTSEAAELLHRLDRPVLWLTLTEGWCGDAAQIVPALHALAKSSANLEVRFLLRDEHPAIMDAFLTRSARSIPKVIFVDPATGNVLGSWGPRPADAQEILLDYKAKMQDADEPTRKALYEDLKTQVHTWYARDRTVSTQREVLQATVEAVGVVSKEVVSGNE